MTKFLVTKTLAQNVLETVDAGLVSGMGVPKPGQMCVEAAVCYAMGLPHSDRPTCVSPAVRALKIRLNDSNWSSNTARANGLRRLALAQLGSNQINDKEFATAVILRPCKATLVELFKTLKIKNDLEKANDLKPFAVAADAADSAADAADAADAAAYAAYAARAACAAAYAARAACAAAYAADAADAACAAADAACAAARAADAARAASYAAYATCAAARDKVLSDFAEGVVQVLIKMDSPGCKFLSLTEG